MPFTLQIWQDQIKTRLQGWKQKMRDNGIYSIYAFIATSTLWPVVEAIRQNDLTAIAALGGALAGVGSNLIANVIQSWKNKTDTDAAKQLETDLAKQPELRAEMDAILEKMNAVPLASQALPEPERLWFVETLREELRRLGNWQRFEAVLHGDGAIAQGTGAVAAGEGGIAIGGNVQGSVLITGNSNVVTPHTLPTKSGIKEKDQ